MLNVSSHLLLNICRGVYVLTIKCCLARYVFLHAIYTKPIIIYQLWLLETPSDHMKSKATRWAGIECAQDVMSVTTLSKILQLFGLCRLDP